MSGVLFFSNHLARGPQTSTPAYLLKEFPEDDQQDWEQCGKLDERSTMPQCYTIASPCLSRHFVGITVLYYASSPGTGREKKDDWEKGGGW